MSLGERYYITTAIDYVNALPHLGTAYEKIGADCCARFRRLMGYDVFFMMGVDEHSVNVEKEAIRRGQDVRVYCDEMSAEFEKVWSALNISYNYFVRTTSSDHIRTVQYMFQVLYDKGDIYTGLYEGWYCNSCEAFLMDKDLVDGNCPTHQSKPQWIKEKNYFFKLSKYRDALLQHIENNPEFIQPVVRRNEIVKLLESGLDDISVTRCGVKWGIPLPFDQDHVVYVWFDALINYLSGVGYPHHELQYKKYWPAQVHVIGKDITRFHCVIWPAMLMGVGVALPEMVFGHGFIYLKGAKMSKTGGQAVGPVEAAEKYGADALRYFLMREVAFDRDGDFTWEGFEQRYDSDLANDLGNLINRSLSMIERYFKGQIPSPTIYNEKDNEIINEAKKMFDDYVQSMKKFRFHEALSKIWSFIQKCNIYVDQSAPWVLAKDPLQKDRLSSVLYVLAESVRWIAYTTMPFIPSSSAMMFDQLGYKGIPDGGFDQLREWGMLKPGQVLGERKPLFPKQEK
ncbi:MAG: methionine--tRNA ligase [Chlamydiota bacterium]|nr:methionine--tRNA ligase [Chlamydiota bacterium]